MNNGIHDTALADRPPNASRSTRAIVNDDELSKLKRELMQAEVRLAKARATAAGAEVDIKVLNARLKALTK
jgi:capsule polysaccharide export protein KpsE/RkpR